jgi:hypothetical protein
MKNNLKNIEYKFKQTNPNISWNSVSNPLVYWPNLDDVKTWNQYPDLKLKRYTMWKQLALELKKLNIQNLLDIGTASGQFVVCCILQNIEAYGIDPQNQFLYSNIQDFQKNNIDVYDHLFLGDIETFYTNFDFNVECISLLNYFHGDDWQGRDLIFLKQINNKIKYLVTSMPKNIETKQFLQDNYEIIYEYKQLASYENHYIFKSRTLS